MSSKVAPKKQEIHLWNLWWQVSGSKEANWQICHGTISGTFGNYLVVYNSSCSTLDSGKSLFCAWHYLGYSCSIIIIFVLFVNKKSILQLGNKNLS